MNKLEYNQMKGKKGTALSIAEYKAYYTGLKNSGKLSRIGLPLN